MQQRMCVICVRNDDILIIQRISCNYSILDIASIYKRKIEYIEIEEFAKIQANL